MESAAFYKHLFAGCDWSTVEKRFKTMKLNEPSKPITWGLRKMAENEKSKGENEMKNDATSLESMSPAEIAEESVEIFNEAFGDDDPAYSLEMGRIRDENRGAPPSLVERINRVQGSLYNIEPHDGLFSEYPNDWKKSNYMAMRQSLSAPDGTLWIFYGFVRDQLREMKRGVDMSLYAKYNFKVFYVATLTDGGELSTSYLKVDCVDEDFERIYGAFIDPKINAINLVHSVKTVANDLKTIVGNLKSTTISNVLTALDIVFNQQKNNVPANLRLK
jgi:hypothetical protein